MRDHGREEELDDDLELPSDDAGPEGRLADKQRARRLQDALMKLSANDRIVVTLRHFSECSYADIAEILGLEEKTVKSRLFDARQRLRALLGDLEGTGHVLH